MGSLTTFMLANDPRPNGAPMFQTQWLWRNLTYRAEVVQDRRAARPQVSNRRRHRMIEPASCDHRGTDKDWGGCSFGARG